MAKAYWLGRVDITNPEKYKEYQQANTAAFKKYNGRFLVRAGKFQIMEGSSRSHNVVVEFDSMDQALACYHSPEYTAAHAIRKYAGVSDMVIIEGVEPAAN